MDYISREAAIEAIEGINWYKYNDEGRLVQGGTSHDKMFLPYKAVEGTLNALPAADVREVKKSKWFDGRCTACGFKPALDYEYATVYDNFNGYAWNYCPNCGAQMDLREWQT